MNPSSLLDLPDELLQSIFALLPLSSLIACQASSKRLAELAAHPLLWRAHCLQSYRFWDKSHDLPSLLQKPVIETDWKELLAVRKRQDQHVRRILNGLLETRVDRLRTMQRITDLGYNAKDVLITESIVPDDAEDALARTYWCNEALGCVERATAIQEWHRMADGEDLSLEQSLGVYDLFTAERPPETLQQITSHIDALAAEYLRDNAELGPPRQSALNLVSWLRSKNLTGLTNQQQYYNLQNNLISIALCQSDHPSLPLISVIIFCCVARRIGLIAHPCGFHSHVLAIVESEPDFTLDGHARLSTSSSQPDRMYLDPFDSTSELSPTTLRAQLTAYGITSSAEQSFFLDPSSAKDMVLRVARNITNSTRWAMRSPSEGDYPRVLSTASALTTSLLSLPHPGALHTRLNRHRARYAASWANVLFTAPSSLPAQTRARALLESLNEFVPTLEPRFACDVPLVHRHIVPLIPPGSLKSQLLDILTSISADDSRPPAPQPRVGLAREKVKFTVGTVFRHARFGYTAVILGWDTKCKLDEEWIEQMRVDSLPGGRDQCFYHAVVADDESTRYVAEENVVVCEGLVEMPEGLGRVAGRWFRRWDRVRGRFVSNVREDFPDD